MSLTVFLARFFGLACLLTCGLLLVRPKVSLAAINAITGNPGVLLVTGAFTTIGGAAAVVGHGAGFGGALDAAVTLLAWATLLKGVALMAMTPKELSAAYRALHTPARFRLAMAAGAAFGAWLAAAGFSA